MEPFVQHQIDQHLRLRREIWNPSDLRPLCGESADEETARRLRAAARALPNSVRVAVVVNTLTEDGLPHFHRLIATYFGEDSPWSLWNRIWTAEEDRHGNALRDYARDARMFSDMGAVERLQYAYLAAGFNPIWDDDPYCLLAYTSLQEKATQISHANTGRIAAPIDPALQCVCAHLAADEARHCHFYRSVFGQILLIDPTRALRALLRVTQGFAMPGASIPGFSAMSDTIRRAGIFGPRQYRDILTNMLHFWHLDRLPHLDAEAQIYRDRLLQIPQRLNRVAERAERRDAVAPTHIRFEFLPA